MYRQKDLDYDNEAKLVIISVWKQGVSWLLPCGSYENVMLQERTQNFISMININIGLYIFLFKIFI